MQSGTTNGLQTGNRSGCAAQMSTTLPSASSASVGLVSVASQWVVINRSKLKLTLIGAAVARRLKGFGCKILYSGRSPKPDVAGPLEAEYVPVNELLARSDFVIPLTPLSDVWSIRVTWMCPRLIVTGRQHEE